MPLCRLAKSAFGNEVNAMKLWIRWIAVLLLMSVCLSVLLACNDETNRFFEDSEEDPFDSLLNPSKEQNKEDPKEDPNQDTPPVDLTDAMILAEQKQTQYEIVYDNLASDRVKELTADFQTRFESKTGAKISIKNDRTIVVPKEIIVSMADGRSQPATEYAKLTAPQKKGYRISIVGEAVVVASQEEYLQEALDLLLQAISDCGDGCWGLPKGYEGELDIPAIQGNGTMYNVGEGNYAYTVGNATDQMVNQFIKDMNADGFSVYSEHTVGTSKFATFVKDSIWGQMVVYTMYHPAIKNFRLTYGPMEYLPNATKQAADNKAAESITQMYMEMIYGSDKLTVSGSTLTANKNAPGMSYVIQLSDGRFIVIDGGSADGEVRTVTYNAASGKWEVSAVSHPSSDAKRLYDTMNSMKPADHVKPRIAAWFISHAHADHWNLPYSFLNDYKNKIELEVLAFNFPEPERGNILDSRLNRMNAFKTVATEDYGAKVWIMHTGQVMELPGASIEVLSTVEDLFCEGGANSLSKEIDLNTTCITFRINIGGMSFVVLGDAYPTTCNFMANAYGDALESDILQLSHHGYNGAVLSLYKAIDPKICLWPCDEFGYNDGVRQGTTSGYQFNYWLRNNPWTRGTTTGDREHYPLSSSTKIDVKTGNVTKF